MANSSMAIVNLPPEIAGVPYDQGLLKLVSLEAENFPSLFLGGGGTWRGVRGGG